MPCNGVAVMQALARKEALADVLELIKEFNIVAQEVTAAGIVKISVIIGGLPVNVAIERDGKITAITQSGTFEEGKKVLEAMIVEALRLRGVNISDLKFEQHRHDHQAPRLAYSTATAQR